MRDEVPITFLKTSIRFREYSQMQHILKKIQLNSDNMTALTPLPHNFVRFFFLFAFQKKEKIIKCILLIVRLILLKSFQEALFPSA